MYILVDATLSGAYVAPVSQSPIYAAVGDNVNFTYRIGLTNSSLNILTNIRVIFTDDDGETEYRWIDLGNNFYVVHFLFVYNNIQFYLEFNRTQVSPNVAIFVNGK